MLGVLLAFGIGALPPAAGTVSHRHADGEVAHVHGGRILGARPGLGTARPAVPGGAEVATPPASGLHDHAVHAVVALQAEAAAPPGVARSVTGLDAVPPAVACPGVRRPGHARAPPVLSA
jgi:hypothetical protein